MTSLLVRGMLVGLIAGLLAFGVARIFGEPQLDRAITFEDQLRRAQGDAPEPDVVIAVYGVALGGLFSLALAAAVFAIGLARRLSARLGPWSAILASMLAFIAIIAAVHCLLPAIDETPAGFPAMVLWRFRLASLGVQAVLWTTLGIGFGIAAERALLRSASLKGHL